MKRQRSTRPWFSLREELELRRLIDQAWPLRETGYATDAAEAIVRWAERTYPDRMERLLDAAEAAKGSNETNLSEVVRPPRVLRLGEAGRA